MAPNIPAFPMNEGYLQQSFRPFYKLLLQSFSKYLEIMTDRALLCNLYTYQACL